MRLTRIRALDKIIEPESFFVMINTRSIPAVRCHGSDYGGCYDADRGSTYRLRPAPQPPNPGADQCHKKNIRGVLKMVGNNCSTPGVRHLHKPEYWGERDDKSNESYKCSARAMVSKKPQQCHDPDQPQQRKRVEQVRRIK